MRQKENICLNLTEMDFQFDDIIIDVKDEN